MVLVPIPIHLDAFVFYFLKCPPPTHHFHLCTCLLFLEKNAYLRHCQDHEHQQSTSEGGTLGRLDCQDRELSTHLTSAVH
jgi:hypothetical protein